MISFPPIIVAPIVPADADAPLRPGLYAELSVLRRDHLRVLDANMVRVAGASTMDVKHTVADVAGHPC